jgi:dTMP kinase
MSKFIVVEGLEGAGKTTALELIKKILSKQSIEFVTTREPGGTPLAEKMRDIVKSETDEVLTPEAELLLMYASRIQLIENVIKPALNESKWVLGDRHDMSSLAYQGGGRQIDQNLIMPIRNAVLKGFEPDLTILMDLDPNIGLARAAARGALDRIEREQIEFFERTRAVYLSLAENNPKVIVIDAGKDLESVQAQITDALTNWLSKKI